MNHHTAAQKGEGGGWHYVSLNSRGGHALGYCANHEPHATEAEARECYAQYQRDNVTLDGKLGGWSDCRMCGAATKSFASIRGDGYASVSLCEDHLILTNAIVELHLDAPAGDAWQS